MEPTQSELNPEDGDSKLNTITRTKNENNSDDDVGHCLGQPETTLPPSSLSSTSSLHSNEGSDFADMAMALVRERVSQCKDSIRETATRIEQHKTAELQSLRQRRQYRAENRLIQENKQKLTIKLREEYLEMENLKVKVMDLRIERRRELKYLVRWQEHIANISKRAEEDSPTEILNKSKYCTTEDIYGESDNEVKQHGSNEAERREQPDEGMTNEEMKLAARAEIAEEIREAKEVKQHVMTIIAKDREDTELDQGRDEEEVEETNSDEYSERLIAGVRASTLCELLDCGQEDLYDPNFADLSSDPTSVVVDKSRITVPPTITELIDAIERYNIRLLDIELMQSIILAENAAVKGKDTFKIGTEGIIVGNDPTFTPTEPGRMKFISRWKNISHRAGETMKTILRRPDQQNQVAAKE